MLLMLGGNSSPPPPPPQNGGLSFSGGFKPPPPPMKRGSSLGIAKTQMPNPPAAQLPPPPLPKAKRPPGAPPPTTGSAWSEVQKSYPILARLVENGDLPKLIDHALMRPHPQSALQAWEAQAEQQTDSDPVGLAALVSMGVSLWPNGGSPDEGIKAWLETLVEDIKIPEFAKALVRDPECVSLLMRSFNIQQELQRGPAQLIRSPPPADEEFKVSASVLLDPVSASVRPLRHAFMSSASARVQALKLGVLDRLLLRLGALQAEEPRQPSRARRFVIMHDPAMKRLVSMVNSSSTVAASSSSQNQGSATSQESQPSQPQPSGNVPAFAAAVTISAPAPPPLNSQTSAGSSSSGTMPSPPPPASAQLLGLGQGFSHLHHQHQHSHHHQQKVESSSSSSSHDELTRHLWRPGYATGETPLTALKNEVLGEAQQRLKRESSVRVVDTLTTYLVSIEPKEEAVDWADLLNCLESSCLLRVFHSHFFGLTLRALVEDAQLQVNLLRLVCALSRHQHLALPLLVETQIVNQSVLELVEGLAQLMADEDDWDENDVTLELLREAVELTLDEVLKSVENAKKAKAASNALPPASQMVSDPVSANVPSPAAAPSVPAAAAPSTPAGAAASTTSINTGGKGPSSFQLAQAQTAQQRATQTSKAAPTTVMEEYVETMRPELFRDVDMRDPSLGTYAYHHYRQQIEDDSKATVSKNRTRRLNRELKALRTSLPLDFGSAVLLRVDRTRPYVSQALIFAPAVTPYDSGAFLFDIFCANDYPIEPPKVNLQTTGQGRVRFNPNLYQNGKVCLSLLGTWNGGATGSENWDPDKSSLYQVLVSIQSAILGSEFPHFNEPNMEQLWGTPEGNLQKRVNANGGYERLRLATIQYAMSGQIRSPPPGFEVAIRTHFRLKRQYITGVVRAWLEEARTSDTVGHFRTLSDVFMELEKDLNGLVLAVAGPSVGVLSSSSSVAVVDFVSEEEVGKASEAALGDVGEKGDLKSLVAESISSMQAHTESQKRKVKDNDDYEEDKGVSKEAKVVVENTNDIAKPAIKLDSAKLTGGNGNAQGEAEVQLTKVSLESGMILAKFEENVSTVSSLSKSASEVVSGDDPGTGPRKLAAKLSFTGILGLVGGTGDLMLPTKLDSTAARKSSTDSLEKASLSTSSQIGASSSILSGSKSSTSTTSKFSSLKEGMAALTEVFPLAPPWMVKVALEQTAQMGQSSASGASAVGTASTKSSSSIMTSTNEYSTVYDVELATTQMLELAAGLGVDVLGQSFNAAGGGGSTSAASGTSSAAATEEDFSTL